MLEYRNITKKFGNKEAVKELTLKLKKGTIYGLLGENGSGKTTLMKMAAGLTQPTEGEILFEGHPLSYQDKASIAYMSTEPFFYSYMKVKDVEEYYADFFEDFDREQFRKTIERLGLNEEMKASAMSSGMNAKLKAAATLARKADLLLLDEPLNGVDYKAREEIIALILEEADENRTMVISTHLIEEVESFIEDAIFIKDGQLVDVVNVETERMIVMVALAVCVLTFFGGMLVEKDALMGISATLLLVGSFFVVFYMGIESILILNRDLKTKQSYMIWMTPKSVWEILGAKFVVAIAQMFFVFALYAIAGLLCFVGTIQYVGELGNVFAIIRDSFIRVSGEGQLIAQIIWNLLCIFVGWTEVVMVGYLAVIVSRTILRDSKYAGGISIVAFFVITFIIEKIYNLISNVLPNVEVAGNSFFGVGYLVYYIIICVAVFLLSGWMADKKLSV